ncbi:MAG: hypothetical protein AB7Q69_09000 [Gemmatimonadales bacterium]
MGAGGAALALLVPTLLTAAGPGFPTIDPGTGPVEFLRSLLGQTRPVLVQDHEASIGSDGAALSFRLLDDQVLEIVLTEGNVFVDDKMVGHYAPGGSFHTLWTDFVAEAGRHPTPEVVGIGHHWEPRDLSPDEKPLAARIHSRLASLTAVPSQHPAPQAIPPAGADGLVVPLNDLSDPARLEAMLRPALGVPAGQLRLTVPDGLARLGSYSVGSGETVTGNLLVFRGNADIYGTLDGNLAVMNGDAIIHPGAVITGDVLALGGAVRDAGGQILGEIRTLKPAFVLPPAATAEPPLSALQVILRNGAGLIGVFITLLALGFSLVLFGRPNLEIVADTVSHSFGRAFVVGLIAQMLVLPTFGMLVVGLLLSVVGVLLIPFAVLAYTLLLLVGIVGGILAVAHALGETYTRRRLALGITVPSPNSYRYVAVGLLAICSLWATWVLFGWVPVAGTLILGAAFLFTWLLVTVGFGATLLSRAGAREAFAGRIIPPEALTDEYLWATPQFGVPAAKRPVPRTPPPRHQD